MGACGLLHRRNSSKNGVFWKKAHSANRKPEWTLPCTPQLFSTVPEKIRYVVAAKRKARPSLPFFR
jgi:hypothetical protein